MDIKVFTSYVFIGLLIIIIRKCALKPMGSGHTELLKNNISISEIINSTWNKLMYSVSSEEAENGNGLDAVEVMSQENETHDERINKTDATFDAADFEIEMNYTKIGIEKLEEAESILNSGVWNFDKRTVDGDSIFTRRLPDGHNVLRLTGVVNMPAKDLFYILYTDLDDYIKWNPSFIECRVLKKIDEQTDISYQVSAAAARGYVSSRDFITLRHWIKRDNNYIAGTCSVTYPDGPENVDYTRGENGPGCWELRPLRSNPNQTEFRWLLNTKLNGWIPQILADNAFKKFMVKYMTFLRQYCTELKAKQSDTSITS